MKMFGLMVVVLLLLANFGVVVGPFIAAPLVYAGAVAGAAVLSAAYYQIFSDKREYCDESECCEEPWIDQKLPNLKAELKSQIFGQHLAIQSVTSAIRAHLRHPPSKALVLSLQGPTGTGKNFISKIVAEQMYAEGMKSRYVHFFSATKHFSQHENIARYKSELDKLVKEKSSKCHQNLFIFDEVQLMPEGLLNVLTPYLKNYNSLDGVDYRRNIFIFIGNEGGSHITEITRKHHQAGGKREDLEIWQFEDKSEVLDGGKGGLRNSALEESRLITHHIPFLPLDKFHVRQCVGKEFLRKGLTKPQFQSMVDQIIAGIGFSRPDGLYSTSGCKKVEAIVGLEVEKFYDN